MQFQKILKNASATNEIGGKLAVSLKHSLLSSDIKSCVVFLQGELGAGKTSLVRACLRELGVVGPIKSPTYTLLEPYDVVFSELSSTKGERPGLKIAHLDLYRLQEPEELDYIGGRDLKENYHLIFVEWPQKAQGYISQPDINIQLNHMDTGRMIVIESLMALSIE